MIESAIRPRAESLVTFLATLPAHDMANFTTLVRISSLRKLQELRRKAPKHGKLFSYYTVIAKAIRILRDQ